MENKMSKANKEIIELENGNLEITTKNGVFEIEDVEYEKIESALKRSNGDVKSVIATVVVKKDGKACKLGELEVRTFKASTVIHFMRAIEKMFGLEADSSFLSNNMQG
jgi:uncharacterized protein (DUF1786 family)